jgi:hypothetical protein
MSFLGCGRRIGADDADELIRQVRCGRDGIVNALRQARVIPWSLCTGDNALVRLTLSMKASEIGMIMGKHSALVGDGIGENFRIANALASTPRLLDRPHVVPETAQFLDNRQREILIRIEPSHEWLVRLVVANVLIDLGRMLSVVVRSRVEIFGREAHDVL